jgi:prepilin signal peptidase PulO-like enzyme (type II secretory pathway)
MNALNRPCPNCGKPTIPVWKLVFWRVRCAHCKADVGTSPAWRLPILSVEMVVWLLALNWLYRDYGRPGLIASFVVWFFVDLVADWYTPLVARRR